MNGPNPVADSIGEGRVEICINNTYGTICDDRWDILEARVVCKQLGHTSNDVVPLRRAAFGSGSGEILLDNVFCRGDESSLLECRSNPIGEHNCDHSEDAGVRCEATCIDGDLRLLEGDDYSLYLTENEIAEYYFVKDEVSRGRVEICMSGQWGTLCNRVWDDIAASVACRQLGFSPHGAIAVTNQQFGEDALPVLITDIQCTGSEQRLLNCTYNTMPDFSCNAEGNDAGVVCQDPSISESDCTNGELRLVDGDNALEGRVEICLNRAWGTVCDTLFTVSETDVICRQLGVVHNGTQRISEITPGSGPIFLDELNCDGDENSLLDCRSFNPRGVHMCTHSQDAGVRCNDYNECLVDNGNCSQICSNLIPGHQCSCIDGYELDDDQRNCSGIFS
jgi:deleted-in-malignant-brain-tumors protein 1